MRKSSYVLGLLMVGLLVVGGAGKSFADDVKISGFGEVQLTLSDDVRDDKGTDSDGKSANDTELKFGVNAEVDIEKTVGSVTVRLDVDLPNRKGITADGDHIEQMRFDWAPEGAPAGLTLTGGFFNSPIGLESQDAPDLVTVTNGQIFSLVPSNLAGLQLSGNQGPISGSLLFVNDTNGGAEDNGFGVTLGFAPMPIANISVGYLSSEADEDTTAAGAPAIAGNGDIIDVIVSGEMPTGEINLSYALEYMTDDFNDAFGITLHAQHGHHGATVRYDSVDIDTNRVGVTKDTTPTTVTVAVSQEIESNLKAQLEWKLTDLDGGVAAGVDDSTSAVLLQFIATF